jgi:signal transduction histidine kinase
VRIVPDAAERETCHNASMGQAASSQAGTALPKKRGRGMSRELVRLRWLAIAAPIMFMSIATYLLRGPAHEQLHHYPGFIYVLLVLAAAVAVFSFAIFSAIGRVENELIERNRQLEAVLSVGRATSSTLGFPDMLDAALDEILGVTSAEAGEVWLFEAGDLVLARQRGLDEEAFRQLTRVRLGEGLPGLAAQSGQPLVVHDLARDPRFLRSHVIELGFQSFGAFPLTRGEETVGVLGVAARDTTAFSSAIERHLLVGIGEQLAVAIENARLHNRVLDEAILEERERLGHELHDGLAQTLGYVNTQTLAIKRLLAAGESKRAQAEVAEMETIARQVYSDVREAILGLRTSSEGLLESVRAYAERFQRLTGIYIHLVVDEHVEALVLPQAVEIQLVRIVQEALANVRKHAGARTARIAIGAASGELRVEVHDDGRGFETDRRYTTGWPHFGLQTMRERAEAIGGRLELSSAPGKGTTVRVSVPVQGQKEVIDARAAR